MNLVLSMTANVTAVLPGSRGAAGAYAAGVPRVEGKQIPIVPAEWRGSEGRLMFIPDGPRLQPGVVSKQKRDGSRC
jgi:hypothetical protein